jgi:hypothetical protein
VKSLELLSFLRWQSQQRNSLVTLHPKSRSARMPVEQLEERFAFYSSITIDAAPKEIIVLLLIDSIHSQLRFILSICFRAMALVPYSLLNRSIVYTKLLVLHIPHSTLLIPHTILGLFVLYTHSTYIILYMKWLYTL